MKRKGSGHAISGTFVFMLLGVFAVISTLLVLLCAQAYRNTVDQTAAHRDERILQSFIRNTLRGEDKENAFGSVEIDGVNALTITSRFDDEVYVRYLYCYEGVLRDLFIGAEDTFHPDFGEEVCPAGSFTASLSDGLVMVEMTDVEGRPYTFSIAQRCAW
ncbi:MAG: DUF4860 domain-containing protein [Christensenellaceae bacterium]|nr:DUF4860 domain-containing protein [Christensenellaceae bacterium]